MIWFLKVSPGSEMHVKSQHQASKLETCSQTADIGLGISTLDQNVLQSSVLLADVQPTAALKRHEGVFLVMDGSADSRRSND